VTDDDSGDDDKDGLTSGIETGMIRLTKWIWEFITKTRWWISKWTICDFQWGDGWWG